MIKQMSESKRVELSQDPNSEKMYGPALMGLPTRYGHIVALIPVPGMRLTAGGREIVITDVTYGADRNIVRCTLESQGQAAVRGWGELYKAIEAGQIEVAE